MEQAPPVATEFSATELAQLRERREKVAADWVATAREQMDTTGDGEVFLSQGIGAEAQEKITRLQAEYDVLSDTIKTHETARDAAKLVAASEDMTKGAPK